MLCAVLVATINYSAGEGADQIHKNVAWIEGIQLKRCYIGWYVFPRANAAK